MPVKLNRVLSLERLDQLFDESFSRPVLLFLHSSTCGISSVVMREVSGVDAEMNLVVVQTERNISNAIEIRTNIRHESPQAIVLKGGVPVFHASHYDITPGALELHLEQNDRTASDN